MEETKDSELESLLKRLSVRIETLANLTYLIQHEAEHEDRVRFFAQLAEKQLLDLRTSMLEALAPDKDYQ